MGILNEKTLIPLGTVVAAVSLSIGAVRTMDRDQSAQDTNIAVLRVQVEALQAIAERQQQLEDVSNGRWAAVQADLAKIKLKLQIK